MTFWRYYELWVLPMQPYSIDRCYYSLYCCLSVRFLRWERNSSLYTFTEIVTLLLFLNGRSHRILKLWTFSYVQFKPVTVMSVYVMLLKVIRATKKQKQWSWKFINVIISFHVPPPLPHSLRNIFTNILLHVWDV